ncbi:MAG: DoxX family protein [Flavobacteriales bacterium]|nr:DoxX family protein [Flavobacteriales bacterium]
MKINNSSFILRYAIAVIFIAHSAFGIFNNGINDFGNLFLNQIGFAPFGVPLAWSIKLIHLFGAFFLLINRYVKLVCILNIFILIMGIILVHFKEGWFVVGGGRNGMEFNFLLIFVLFSLYVGEKNRFYNR